MMVLLTIIAQIELNRLIVETKKFDWWSIVTSALGSVDAPNFQCKDTSEQFLTGAGKYCNAINVAGV